MTGFDGIANKFDQNIYGTTKGRLRHAILCHHLDGFLQQDSISVIDIGGGTGAMAVEFAQKKHNVTNVDVSEEALKIADEKLVSYANAKTAKSSLFDWHDPADLIICHAVLEWLENPFQAIAHLINLLPLDGHLSLSFFNQDAKLFSNILYGNFDYIARGMRVKNQVRLNPDNPQKPQEVLDFVNSLPNALLVKTAGIRCFHDYLQDKNQQQSHYNQLLEVELAYGEKEPFIRLGKYFYCLVKKI